MIVCATVDSQCLEYILGIYNIAPISKFDVRHWWYLELNVEKLENNHYKIYEAACSCMQPKNEKNRKFSPARTHLGK